MKTFVKRFIVFSLLFGVVAFLGFGENSEGRSGELRIVTYNVWYGLDGHGLLKMGEYESGETREKRLKLLIEGLKELDPDIVFLQEVNPVNWVTGRLKKELGYDAVYQLYNGGIKFFWLGIPTNLCMGLTILAKKDLHLKWRGSGQISGPWGLYSPAFAFHLTEARFILSATVKVGDREVYLFHTHTHAAIPKDKKMFEEVEKWVKEGKIKPEEEKRLKKEIEADWARREKELKAIGEYVAKKAKGKPFILGGDFNTTLFSESMQKLVRSLNLTDTFYTVHPNEEGFTWDSVNNPNTKNDASLTFVNGDKKEGVELLSAMYDQSPRRIDFILIGGGLDKKNVVDSRVIFNRPVNGLYPSDHYGVLSVIHF